MMKELGIPANLYGLADSFCAGGMLLVSLLLGSFKMPKNYLLTTGRIGIILAGDFIILALASKFKINFGILTNNSIGPIHFANAGLSFNKTGICLAMIMIPMAANIP